MGLDITVHLEIEPVAGPPMDAADPEEIDWDAAWERKYVHVFVVSPGFAQSLGGLTNDSWVRSTGDTWGFRAGSYSGYGQFRDELAQVLLGVNPAAIWAEPDDYRKKPFFELLHFADNEGTIGGTACAALAWDFITYREVYAKICDDYFMSKYDEWTRAFTEGVLVEFH